MTRAQIKAVKLVLADLPTYAKEARIMPKYTWESFSDRRERLIDLDVAGKATEAERAELATLQAAIDRYLDLVSPIEGETS